MKKDREKFLSSIYVIIRNKDNKILLQRRQGTKLWPGYLALPAGHLDVGENVYDALIRETKEELDIDISINDIVDTFVVNRRNKTLSPYFDVYFEVAKYKGDIKINEPNKCSELIWASLDKLPDDMIDFEKYAIYNNLKGIKFSVIDELEGFMNNEQVKEELMKRYMYLYQNKELILSLCIHSGIEKKEIEKKIKEFKNILKNCKDDEMVSNTIEKIINDYKVELNTEKYYLMSNVNDNVVSMFEEFLFSDFDMEELDLYKHIEAVKGDEKYLGSFNYLIEQLEDRRSSNSNLSNIPTFTVWKILSYVRKKNSNNKVLLDALDKYYNIDRFVITNSDCMSGYKFLESDYDNLSEDILDKYPNSAVYNWDKFGGIVILPNKNCYEEEDEYFDGISDENITYDNNAKSCFMLDLANMTNLDIESKEYIRNNLIIDKKKLVKN